MKRKFLFPLVLFTIAIGYAQTKLTEITFESPGRYSTSIPEFTDYSSSNTNSGRDYFLRTDGSNILAEKFNNIQGSYYFTAQDIDGEGATLPVYISINNINISGYSNLEFRVHLAEDDAITDPGEHWDRNDYVHFNYNIDKTSSLSNLLWIETNADDSNQSNRVPQIDTDFDGIGDGSIITDTFTQYIKSISGTGNLLDIEIELNLNAELEDIAIDNIEIWGTLDSCLTSVTWDGTSWSNGTGPDITSEAILNADYTTSSSIGSFSVCNLILNNADLLIADNTFIEIQNDISVDLDSSINIEPYGSIIQNNDLGSIINNGTMSVEKETAPMNNADEYTYWSSPVSGVTVDGTITQSNPNSHYTFNGQNFVDATAESENNNAQIPGQDDIDDNGDDWQHIGGNTIMQPGIGYATTISHSAYKNAPGLSAKQFKFSFNGDFNNGYYSVPIYRNDSEKNDINWNFVGNPYPSAIDADLFLESNGFISNDIAGSGYIDGAIFLWSQNTLASNTANGNQTFNLSNNDYAVINLAGEVAGGDGTTPVIILPSGHRCIPSGQGFFVSMSDEASAALVSGDIYTTNIAFSNAMRIANTSANSTFFKTSNSKKTTTNTPNKLWLNMTSENGVFSQILISYLNGATNKDDGASYDVTKFPTEGCSMYSILEGSNKKYAIQAKSPSSLNITETTSLGFKTTIPIPTLYTISIDHLQGNFFNTNSIYLKDKLLSSIHNLSHSNYSFSSEVGEFNNRFEVMLQNQALSTIDASLDNNKFKIIALDNHRVQFRTAAHLEIKNISIFDLSGRQVYHLKGHSSSETHKLSKLKRTVYIIRAKLSNGDILTKKMIIKQ